VIGDRTANNAAPDNDDASVGRDGCGHMWK
jgi:hypothetical protein